MSRARRSNERALTLIELLAVVVILAIVSMLGIAGLARMDNAAKLERFIFEWRELDARARILASMSELPSQPELTREGSDLRLRAGETTFGRAQLNSANGRCELLPTDREVGSVAFDSRGCSPDYTMIVHSTGGVERWTVAGETGWIERIRRVGGGS